VTFKLRTILPGEALGITSFALLSNAKSIDRQAKFSRKHSARQLYFRGLGLVSPALSRFSLAMFGQEFVQAVRPAVILTASAARYDAGRHFDTRLKRRRDALPGLASQLLGTGVLAGSGRFCCRNSD